MLNRFLCCAFVVLSIFAIRLPADEFTVPPGFQVEELYRPPLAQQGSWVSLCLDPQGNFFASDQYGYIYHITPPPLGQTEGTAVRRIPLNAGKAQGLLWAYDSLYFTGDPLPPKDPKARSHDRRSLWRARDTTGDGELDELTLLLKMDAGGEHGPHAVVLGPDQKIYFAAGNHTKVPEFARSAVPPVWNEDHLLPRMWDARGHARGVMAPGGWIARMNPDGSDLEMVSIGYRNQYDIAFDENGELFTFDSDMEWDFGMPWYRPTRINHATSGSEFGWRSGSGKWPDEHPDNLPPTLDIGPSSPTGVAFGTGAKFPWKYQRALYAMDWSFGTLYAVHLEPDGASYKGTREVFLSRNSLPLTDLVVRPQDGAMYFVTGGRRTQGGFYRVTYTGDEPTSPAPPIPLNEAQQLRRTIEAHHRAGDPKAIPAAWPHLDSADRFIRFAARTAVELQPVAEWREQALSESRPRALRELVMALARCSEDSNLQPKLIERLLTQDWTKLDDTSRLEWLRACSLVFIRLGEPNAAQSKTLLDRLDGQFPTSHHLVNRELGNLLIYLKSPTIVAKAVEQMYSAKDPEQEAFDEEHLKRGGRYGVVIAEMQREPTHKQQIHFAFNLRVAETGWTPELRDRYFGWFATTRQWKGGNSFHGFLNNARDEALAHVADVTERSRLLAMSASSSGPMKALPRPKGPGRAWTVGDFAGVSTEQLQTRDLNNGKRMYQAALCASCHRFAGEGSAAGPDLTGSGGRYTVSDLLTAIIDPNREISDQYAFTEYRLRGGRVIAGRVAREDARDLHVFTTFLVPDALTPVRKDEIASERLSRISGMMPGLINALNRDEVLDLLAYLMLGAQ
jgi:putative heme-binding domain-containing protein